MIEGGPHCFLPDGGPGTRIDEPTEKFKFWLYDYSGVKCHAPWFASMEERPATVLRAFAHQFDQGGTEALETESLWDVPEIQSAGGITALKLLGKPVEIVHEAKYRLFGA